MIYKSGLRWFQCVKFLPCSCSFFLSSLSSLSLRLAFAFRCDFSLHGSDQLLCLLSPSFSFLYLCIMYVIVPTHSLAILKGSVVIPHSC